MVFLSSTGAPGAAAWVARCDAACMPFKVKPAIPTVAPTPDARRNERRDSASGALGILGRLGREGETLSDLRMSIALPPRPSSGHQCGPSESSQPIELLDVLALAPFRCGGFGLVLIRQRRRNIRLRSRNGRQRQQHISTRRLGGRGWEWPL